MQHMCAKLGVCCSESCVTKNGQTHVGVETDINHTLDQLEHENVRRTGCGPLHNLMSDYGNATPINTQAQTQNYGME